MHAQTRCGAAVVSAATSGLGATENTIAAVAARGSASSRLAITNVLKQRAKWRPLSRQASRTEDVGNQPPISRSDPTGTQKMTLVWTFVQRYRGTQGSAFRLAPTTPILTPRA